MNTTTDPIDLLTRLDWSNESMIIQPDQAAEGRLKGPIVAWVANPTSELSKAWAEHQATFKSLRVFCLKLRLGGFLILSIDNPRHLRKTANLIQGSRSANSDITVPSPPGMEFKPFQRAGIEYARTHKNVLFGDEMGLGKTIQAIGVVNDNPDISRILVVCPAYLKLNWRHEIKLWQAVKRPVFIVNSGEFIPRLGPEGGWVIINYEILHRMTSVPPFDTLIVDEAHFIKNLETKRTKAVLDVKADRKLALTGTPALNRPIELYPIVSMMMGPKAPSYWSFAKQYCDAKKGAFGMEVKGCSNPIKLQQFLRSNFMVRRLKKDVLKELPPKQRQIIELQATSEIKVSIDMERSAWQLHEDTLAEMRLRRDEAEISGDDATFQDIGKSMAKQIQIAFTAMALARVKLSEQKVPFIFAHLRDVMSGNNEKFIVFFHHKTALMQLHQQLEEAGIKSLVITGDVSMPHRDERVREFQSNPDCRVILGSIGAMGTGVTLTASSTVIMAELDWRPGIMAQAEDRAHRIGQIDSVLCQYFLFENSVDSKMIGDVISKMENIGRFLDGEGEAENEQQKVKREPKKKAERNWESDVKSMTPSKSRLIHESLRYMMGLDSDMARARNNQGFSKFDAGIGHRLGSKDCLTNREAAFAAHLLHKYRRQLPRETVVTLWGNV